MWRARPGSAARADLIHSRAILPRRAASKYPLTRASRLGQAWQRQAIWPEPHGIRSPQNSGLDGGTAAVLRGVSLVAATSEAGDTARRLGLGQPTQSA